LPISPIPYWKAGIVISVNILGLKFVPYIADTWNLVLETEPRRDSDYPAEASFKKTTLE
jgi:hypothetical protein